MIGAYAVVKLVGTVMPAVSVVSAEANEVVVATTELRGAAPNAERTWRGVTVVPLIDRPRK